LRFSEKELPACEFCVKRLSEVFRIIPVTDAAITAYGFDLFRLDLSRAVLRGPDGAERHLRPKAFALLWHLLDNAGRLIGREDLLDALWPGLSVTDDSLTQCVSEIRQALGDRAGHVLRTVPRRGYVLLTEVTPLARGFSRAAPGCGAGALLRLRPGGLQPRSRGCRRALWPRTLGGPDRHPAVRG
jgi:DNA-binding winged helix-turn-helix (wHTH) protein